MLLAVISWKIMNLFIRQGEEATWRCVWSGGIERQYSELGIGFRNGLTTILESSTHTWRSQDYPNLRSSDWG